MCIRDRVWFLVQLVGDGTRKLATVKQGDIVNVVMPLGNGFTMPCTVPTPLCKNWKKRKNNFLPIFKIRYKEKVFSYVASIYSS